MPYGANKRSDYLFVVTLSVAVLLYLLTDSTLAAVVLPCMHGGWNTLHTGIWLLRSDPHRRRGRVCFAFYVAAACWKAAAAAFVSIIVFRIVEDRLGAKPNMAEFETTMFVLAGGVVFTTLIGLGATCAALRYHIRVWVHPNLRTLLDDDLRSIGNLRPLQNGCNHAIFVVAIALVFPLLCVGTVCLMVLTVGKARDECATLSATLLVFVTMFGGPFAMIPCYAWLSHRIIATTPQECWPEGSL